MSPLIALHASLAGLALVIGAMVGAGAARDRRSFSSRAHKGFMVGTLLGLVGAGLGALAPGRALSRLLF